VTGRTFSTDNIASGGFQNTFGGTSDQYVVKFSSCAPPPLPLSIELLSFSGYNKVYENVLEWQTASETNNNYFTIEKNEDGNEWEVIGKVKGAGSSTNAHSYSFLDAHSYNGINYYRLKQTDYACNFTYSQIISIKSAITNPQSAIVIYPNPASDIITIRGNMGKLSADTQVRVVIYDVLGQEVFNSQFSHPTGDYLQREILHPAGDHPLGGNSQFSFDISFLLKGIYFIKAGTAQIKFIKE
jgi:hypothetical protein